VNQTDSDDIHVSEDAECDPPCLAISSRMPTRQSFRTESTKDSETNSSKREKSCSSDASSGNESNASSIPFETMERIPSFSPRSSRSGSLAKCGPPAPDSDPCVVSVSPRRSLSTLEELDHRALRGYDDFRARRESNSISRSASSSSTQSERG